MLSCCRFAAIAGALAVAGCSQHNDHNRSPFPSISGEAKHRLDKPVNCATAKQDVEALEAERASVGERALAGVRTVMPIAAVAGIISNDYNDRMAVALGDYNADLEAKIADIRSTCNLPASN